MKTTSLFSLFFRYRFVRFCLIGGIAFLIDAGSAWLLVRTLPKIAALATAYTLSCIFHYTSSRQWTFEDRRDISARQLWAYVGANLITLITNTALSNWLLHLVDGNVFLAKAVALPPTSILGFVLLKMLVFKSGSEVEGLN